MTEATVSRDMGEAPLLWTCQRDGVCDHLGIGWQAWTGRGGPPDDAWWAVVHPDDEVEARAAWQAAVSSTAVFAAVLRLRRADGVYRRCSIRAEPVLDADGHVVRWLGCATELATEQAVTSTSNNELESLVVERTQQLQRSNDRLNMLTLQLRTAQRLTRVGSWQFEIDSDEVVWSDELFRVFRMEASSGAPNYKAQQAMFEPESWSRLAAAVGHSVATGDGYELSLGIVRQDGERGTAIARAEAVVDEHGHVVRLVGTFQDVTERERIDKTLRGLNERLQLATSAAHMGVWDWDVASNTMIWDDAMHALYGTPPDNGVSGAETWRRALHPDDREHAQRVLREALDGGRPFDTTFRIITASGEIKHLHAAALVHDEVGGPRVVGINRDITNQRTAELALQRSEALRRAVVDHAGPLIIATDVDGTITLFNKAAETLLGYRAAELIGWATPALFRDEHALGDPFEVVVARVRSRGIDVHERTYVCRNGNRVPVLLTVTPLRDEQRTTIGFLGVAVDLTARKIEEQNLLRLNALLAERSAQTEVLLQEVHHRVKNNLQIIASLMNMQIRKVTDAGARAALQECRTRVDSIALIHEQLYQSKDYARIPFSDYCKKLTQTIFDTSGTTPDRVSLTVDVQPVALTVDKAIPCGLVLNELITNALKHAFVDGRRGTINVSFRATDDGKAILVVADDGVGTAGSPSARASSSLGMQLINTLVKQLGGHLDVNNDRGTQATLIFPTGAAGV